jgi:UDP-N-acetylmuramyl-tripeptide synthetase
MLCAFSMDVDIDDCLKAVESFPGAPGRFERVEAGQHFPVIVDFAHSPDSLEKLIRTYRPLVKGKIILVFGCPGDRDKEKRPIMGELAVKLADHVIISTDDPHSESPEAIVNEIETGIKKAVGGNSRIAHVEKIIDRREAIKKALSLAKKDDVVLIAGRGHEKYQDFNGKKVEIDDREVAKQLLTS